MSSRLFLIILLVLGAMVVLGTTAKPDQTEATQSSPLLAAQTKTIGAVDVTVTPKTISAGESPVFELALDTHSVELEYDFTQIVTLSDNENNRYQAMKWSGGNGGHHLSGELTFDSLSTKAKTITLTIDNIADQSTSFMWNL